MSNDGKVSISAVLKHYGAQSVPEGNNRSMKCPFHNDTHASGSVSTEKQVFYCHTCGIAGDGYSIIMHQEGKDYRGAVAFAEEHLDGISRAVRREPGRDGSHLPFGPRTVKRNNRGTPAWRRRD